MITDFSCWVDVDIARFQKYKKIRKIKIYKKKEEKRRKGKVEGLVWKPSKTSPINTMLRRKIQGGEKILDGGKGQPKKHPKPKYISFFASRRPSPSLGQRQRKPSWPTLPLKNQRAPLCHWGLLPSPHFPTHTVPFPSLSLLSCRSPSWSKKGDAAPLSWNKPRKPKGKLFLSFSRPQTPSAPASRPRSQHLLHF